MFYFMTVVLNVENLLRISCEAAKFKAFADILMFSLKMRNKNLFGVHKILNGTIKRNGWNIL